MSEPTFGELFRARVEKIGEDAKAKGINLSVVCRGAGISRATPDRWRKKMPKTIEIIDKMEQVIAAHGDAPTSK